MAYSREIEKVMKEFDHNLWTACEAYLDSQDEKDRLQAEIDEHVCD